MINLNFIVFIFSANYWTPEWKSGSMFHQIVVVFYNRMFWRPNIHEHCTGKNSATKICLETDLQIYVRSIIACVLISTKCMISTSSRKYVLILTINVHVGNFRYLELWEYYENNIVKHNIVVWTNHIIYRLIAVCWYLNYTIFSF